MNANIASRLPHLAKEFPARIAVSAPIKGRPIDKKKWFIYEELTFSELDERSNLFAHQLQDLGLKRGQKVLMFIRPGLDFSAMTFAVFRAGLIPVFIDPGMGRKNLLEAVAHIRPDGLIAEPEVHLMRLIFPKAFRSVKFFITTRGPTWGEMASLSKWRQLATPSDSLMEEMAPEDTAAVLFTSGGTGIPKGVRYTHKIFNAQVDRLKTMFNLDESEVDLPGFPLFSLFTITMGMKSAIPAMNPSRPSECNPEWLVKNIMDHKATFVAGSPAIWKRVADFCELNSITLPSVKYLVMFGAPVSLELHEKFQSILINGDTYTPYGATECLPVSNINGKSVLEEFAVDMNLGKGTCVGKPAPGTIIKIAPITEDPLVEGEFEWLKVGALGEICVLSDTVTPEYVGMPEKTLEAKIPIIDGRLWHRMGDLGYLDTEGRLWFCGRKSHRVTINNVVYPSVPQENPFLKLPLVQKCAFIGPLTNGETIASLIIEPKRKLSSHEKNDLEIKLRDLAKRSLPGTPIRRVLFHSKFPVDVRHNIKIDRLKLKEMVEKGTIR
ncbi:MAG: AMP-binding protein [Bacteriovoracaceae bacterium]|nr:AMP-binding protein [Bacteriovoracaceae bacterium]